MFPIAATVAVRAVRDQAGSALPDAPVTVDAPPPNSLARRWITAYLRMSAQRRTWLADRIDHSRPARTASAAGLPGGCAGGPASVCLP